MKHQSEAVGKSLQLNKHLKMFINNLQLLTGFMLNKLSTNSPRLLQNNI